MYGESLEWYFNSKLAFIKSGQRRGFINKVAIAAEDEVGTTARVGLFASEPGNVASAVEYQMQLERTQLEDDLKKTFEELKGIKL